MIQYHAIKMFHPVAGHTFGIKGVELDENGEVTYSVLVPDVSCDYSFVSHLASVCTNGQLAPEQLLDVIYDSLP